MDKEARARNKAQAQAECQQLVPGMKGWNRLHRLMHGKRGNGRNSTATQVQNVTYNYTGWGNHYILDNGDSFQYDVREGDFDSCQTSTSSPTGEPTSTR